MPEPMAQAEPDHVEVEDERSQPTSAKTNWTRPPSSVSSRERAETQPRLGGRMQRRL
jgi:hypothetical protein